MRTVPLYLLLVGTPLLGLLGVLRVGERLDAPPDLSGAWAVDTAFARAVERGCAPRAFAEATALDVEQSGRFLRLTANDAASTTFEGRFVEGTVLASGERAGTVAARAPCSTATASELRLRLLDDGAVQRLAGAWGLPGCAACRPLPFRASRPLPS